MAGRPALGDAEERAAISAPESLRSVGFPDLILGKAGPQHQETVISCYDYSAQKMENWVELSHLMNWSTAFVTALSNNKDSLATLELIRGADEYPIALAKFHVDESIRAIESALCCNVGLDLKHPDTREHNYAVCNIMIDDSICLGDIVRQVFTCLFSKCAVRLVVKTNSFYSATISAYLVDLMHGCGATTSEIQCVAFDRRETIGNEHFSKPFAPNKNSKLSVVATVFRLTDTFAAAQGIIESYFREQFPNLIILVEEAAYERFCQDWQRYYSHALHIGSRLDERTNVTDSLNSKVQVDLAAIDIKASHKMSGNVINVLRFRTYSELNSLLSNLRKVPFMTVWNDDILFSREFCMRLNQCNEFWIDHIPKSIAGYKLPEEMLDYYYATVSEDMTYIYNSVYAQFSDEAEQLRKTLASFMKKDCRLRTTLTLMAFVSIVSKSKSLKNGSSVTEAVARLKRFQRSYTRRLHTEAESRIETVFRPVGLALLFVREESSVKNKAILLELIFKNLLIGNAVLLACPPNTLGARFTVDNDHVIPFKMVHEALPDISRLSLDQTIDVSETSLSKKQCPKNTFAIEILPDLTSDSCSTITVALGTRRKHILTSDVEQANYWSNE